MATDTKERILDVAEHLFADSGFATTSLRDITSGAGVNLAAVNYHFGSKEGLLSAVLHRRIGPVNERRLARLDELARRAEHDAPQVDDILRAFLTPPFELRAELGARGATFTRLMGRVHAETNDDFRKSFVEQFSVVVDRFSEALQRASPSLDPSELSTRMSFVIGSMAYMMMWGDAVGSAEGDTPDPETVLESLIEFGAAGMSAPARRPVRVRAVGQSRGAGA